MRKMKSWRDKLQDSKDLLEVYEIMARIPEGKLITIDQIRKTIAPKHGADVGCLDPTPDKELP